MRVSSCLTSYPRVVSEECLTIDVDIWSAILIGELVLSQLVLLDAIDFLFFGHGDGSMCLLLIGNVYF